MKNILLLICMASMPLFSFTQAQTPIPNSDFETWIDHGTYEDPQYWDTPNEELMSIPFFGTTVVNKSTEHQSGLYSARLETKSITLVGEIPGVVTLGHLTINITTMGYTITGGAPVFDVPTHLKGYYKFFPSGGDSCAIGIGLMKWNGVTRDSIGYGVFSTKDTVPEWTPFTAWIYYDTLLQPDTMNVLAISSATETPTAGTILFIDGLYLDYTVSLNEEDPAAGIDVYNDRETGRLLVFTDFAAPQSVAVSLYSMTGQRLFNQNRPSSRKERIIVPYNTYPDGIYILEVFHGEHKYTRKYFLSR